MDKSLIDPLVYRINSDHLKFSTSLNLSNVIFNLSVIIVIIFCIFFLIIHKKYTPNNNKLNFIDYLHTNYLINNDNIKI